MGKRAAIRNGGFGVYFGIAFPGERTRMRGSHLSPKTGNRVPAATRQVGVTTRVSVLAIVVFGFLTGFAAPAVAAENMPVSANELVREIITNEIKVEAADHSHWAFQLQTEKAGKREVDQVVETKDGNLQFPISIDGRPHYKRETAGESACSEARSQPWRTAEVLA